MLLGIDIGTKFVGTALSDPEERYSMPHKVFDRKGNAAQDAILALVAQKGIKIVVAGLPLNAKGERTSQCKDVERFCRRLTKRAKIDLKFVDEFGTSEEALEKRRAGGKPSSNERVDAMAAALILQAYIESK